RTATNNRLYSENDCYRLAKIRDLSQKGINIAGIRAILGTNEVVVARVHYIGTTQHKVRVKQYGQGRRD
ncbi:MAG: MerR family transcriptional regulator, partial [Firmicutes bacterium]|nr:MerR family transcriptional regulator [Bacillota bacterium]